MFEEQENLKIKELETIEVLNLIIFKKTTKEKSSIYDVAKFDCVVPFLEILDNFKIAIGLVVKKNKFSEEINLVINKFYDVLKKIGVTEIKSL